MKRILAILTLAAVAFSAIPTATADTFTAAEQALAAKLVYEVPQTQKVMRDYVVRAMVWLNSLSSSITTLGPITVAPTSALTNAVILTDADIGNAINLGDNPIIGTDIRLNATLSAQMNVSAAATTWSGIDVAANADAEDVMLRTTGTEGDILLVSADDVSVDVAANGIINLGDNAVLKRINIGGNSTDGNDAVYISTEATTADIIAIGNANAATTLSLTGGTAWSVSNTGTITTADDLAVNGDNINADGTLIVTGATGLTLTATAGTAAVNSIDAFNVLVSAAAIASGITVTCDADAEDLFLTTTGSEGDIVLTSADDVLVDVAAGAVISVGNNAVAKTINIGGASVDGADTVNISTDATTADSISIGNVAVASTLVLEAGTGATGIQIGNGGTAHGIQIGSNVAAAQAIVVGSANAASTLGLTSGTAWSMTGAGYLSQTPVAVADAGGTDTVACAANWCVVTTKSLATAAGDCYSITVTNANVAATTGAVATQNAYTGTGFPLVRMVTPGAGSSAVQVCNIHAANALNAAVTFTLHVGD